MIDGSFKSNIAFGLNDRDIDMDRVRNSAKISKIDSFIEKTKFSYETKVGERGVLLSGGQRQRIAIARAIYKGKMILILDEATSALDNNNEKLVMNNIYKKNKNITIINIAHRLNTLEDCNKIFIMENGTLKKINAKTFKELNSL